MILGFHHSVGRSTLWAAGVEPGRLDWVRHHGLLCDTTPSPGVVRNCGPDLLRLLGFLESKAGNFNGLECKAGRAAVRKHVVLGADDWCGVHEHVPCAKGVSGGKSPHSLLGSILKSHHAPQLHFGLFF